MSKKDAHQRARKLRRNQTPSEKIVWEQLRNRKFCNLKFYRQYPIHFTYENRPRFIIADFYCRSRKLIIEIDGKYHEEIRDRDELRDFVMDELGIKTFRFSNREVEQDLEGVLKRISGSL
jgi:very-short-patch-repair endonuclease